MSLGERIEAWTQRLNDSIVDSPRRVIVVFLVLTLVFAGGIGLVSTDTEATDSFTEGLEEQEALDAVNQEFEDPFQPEQESTQIIHSGSNVLTREALLRNLLVLEKVEARDDLRVASATGPATVVAQTLDPSAQTITEQRQAIKTASPSRVRQTVRQLATNPRFSGALATDFNPTSASASASITVVTHDVPPGFADLQRLQTTIRSIAEDQPGQLTAFGSGVTNAETANVIGDSLTIVMPVVVILLLLFLVVAYRDPIDLSLGLLSLLLTVVWTFGFLGLSGIPFNQQMITVPVLLLAVGVDFGIHIINRYREEAVAGYRATEAMREANNQLIIAFIIVTVTTVFGFGANVISDLTPIRNVGIASAIGIIFTFLIFGLFLPAAKLEVDKLREAYNVPEFNSAPISSEDSTIGKILTLPTQASQYAPIAFVVVLLVTGGMAGVYGSGVDTSFETEDFLPPEEQPDYITSLPEPFAPSEYTVTETLNLLEDRFSTNQDQSVKLYVQGNFEEDHALEALADPNDDAVGALAVDDGGSARPTSIVTVIQSHAERNPEFARLVAQNDVDGNGIPDRNLGRIYDVLFSSSAGDRAEQYLTPDRRNAQVEYAIDSSASQGEAATDAREFAEQFRYTTTATGQVVVFDAVTDIIFDSSIQGLIIALALTALFLIISYGVLEGKPLLGVVNVFPILIAIAFLLGTMRYLGISLNALTGTILSISIGLGIAYSVHATHRFVDEYNAGADAYESMIITLSGTGGALLGSMLTTSLGTGALALAITPVLGDFGLLMAISVVYSFIFTIIALPPAVLLWERYQGVWSGFDANVAG
ncbi:MULTISPECIES: RND family transporter [Halorubrum]|uniref:efflux RND transporter permease subunit n=1 Tax=Halorubrum TaxID=56688 RepID=UPI000BD0C493|nr:MULTISPECIES: MMPL family transporter [Halorubrum]MDV7350302.1 MMPL family transporter [Halorubrum distributum]OYR83563.1 RND transporter [Halorubrum sp. E3]TKX44692.1 RND transporter [Halorubrum sp. ARQ200]TKX48692.1 RND transporter [Halorubrum sp. ASP121]